MQLSCHACDTFKERFRPFQGVLEAQKCLQLYQVSKQSHSDDSLVILARHSSCTLQQQYRPELGIGRARGERPLTCLSGPPPAMLWAVAASHRFCTAQATAHVSSHSGITFSGSACLLMQMATM